MAGALPGAAAAAGQVESAGRRRYRTDQYVIYIYIYIFIGLTCAAEVFSVRLCELLLTNTVRGAGVGPAAGAAGVL